MPQIFLSVDAVIELINAAPGKTISHADLVAQLNAAGYRNVGRSLLDYKRSGSFTGKTDYDGTNKPVLIYSLNS